jgi:hypothetical protein
VTTKPRALHPFVGEMAVAQPTGRPHHYTSPAGDYRVPIEYRGVRTFLATFPVPLDVLRAILPSDVKPRRLHGSAGGLVIQLVDAPDTSIGPCNECILSVIVEDDHRWPHDEAPVDWAPPVCYIVWLGVDAPLALYSGQSIWGFPKMLAETRYAVDQERFSATVAHDGRAILSCEGTLPLDGEPGVVCLRSLTHLHGELCRVAVYGRCMSAVAQPGDCRLRFHPGTKISATLSALLAPQALLDAPVSVHYLRDHDYRLNAPVVREA